VRTRRLREVRGVEAPEASGPDFTGVTVPGASSSNVEGEGAELGASGRGGQSGTWGSGSSGSTASTVSFDFSLHLEVEATLATIVLQISSRQGLSHAGRLRTASCKQCRETDLGAQVPYNYPINFIDYNFVYQPSWGPPYTKSRSIQFTKGPKLVRS
jgi:hypothetical protein